MLPRGPNMLLGAERGDMGGVGWGGGHVCSTLHRYKATLRARVPGRDRCLFFRPTRGDLKCNRGCISEPLGPQNAVGVTFFKPRVPTVQ